MFDVDSNKNIHMCQGDTGGFVVRPSGYNFSSGDVALFTVKSDRGIQKLQRIYPITNGIITVRFENEDTDTWQPGRYRWEMRYFVGPVYDENEQLISGQEVFTPKKSDNTRNLYIHEALGNV